MLIAEDRRKARAFLRFDSTLTSQLSTLHTMNLPPDYHMHTPLCRHASGEPVDYARRAVELGFTEIGFTDHSPMARDDFDDWRMLSSELDVRGKVRLAQRTFPQLTIRLGLEVDYLPGHEGWIRDLAVRHPWDYFIGSVHYVSDGWAIDNPNKLSEWKKRDSFEVWKIYFDLLTRAAETGLFEIIGHADLPKSSGIVRCRIARRSTNVSSPPPSSTTAPSNSTPPGCARSVRKFIRAGRFLNWLLQKACPSPSVQMHTSPRKSE